MIAIDSATIESNPRALKEEYELAGLSRLGLVGLAVGFFPVLVDQMFEGLLPQKEEK